MRIKGDLKIENINNINDIINTESLKKILVWTYSRAMYIGFGIDNDGDINLLDGLIAFNLTKNVECYTICWHHNKDKTN